MQSSPNSNSHGAMSHRKHRIAHQFSRGGRDQRLDARRLADLNRRIEHREPMYDTIREALEAARRGN